MLCWVWSEMMSHGTDCLLRVSFTRIILSGGMLCRGGGSPGGEVQPLKYEAALLLVHRLHNKHATSRDTCWERSSDLSDEQDNRRL